MAKTKQKSPNLKLVGDDMIKARKVNCPDCSGHFHTCIHKKRRILNDQDMEYCTENLFVLAYKKIKKLIK